MSAKISPQNRLRDDITQSNGLQLALTSLFSKLAMEYHTLDYQTNGTHLWIILKEIPPLIYYLPWQRVLLSHDPGGAAYRDLNTSSSF